MKVDIDFKVEEFKKKVIIKQRINGINIFQTFLPLVILFIFLKPFYSVYLNDSGKLSTEIVIPFLLIIIFIFLSQFMQYLSRIYIIKDINTGFIKLQKKHLLTKSVIFNKNEEPRLRLSKSIFQLFGNKKSTLFIETKNRKEILDVDLISQLFDTKKWYLRNRNEAFWMFTEKNAKDISQFIEIPLLSEEEFKKQALNYIKNKKLSNTNCDFGTNNVIGINSNEAIRIIIMGLVGFFVGFLGFVMFLGIGFGIGLSETASLILGMLFFFLIFIFFARLGRERNKKNNRKDYSV